MSDALTVQLIADPGELDALGLESERLAQSMHPRLPFATRNWLALWWQHFQERRLLVGDRFYMHALRDGSGRLIGLAPLMLTERPSFGPLRARALAFLGGDKNITELRGLICAPEDEARVTSSLVAHLLERREDWDWFAWHGVRANGQAHAFLSSLGHFEWRSEVTGYGLPLPETWEEFRSSRSRNIKEALRKCYNSLHRDGYTFTFRVVEDAAELGPALERFFDLHARRARASHLPDHADYFTRLPARELLRGLARTPGEAPGLRVLELWIDERLVATRLAFLVGDQLYLYFSGFDPAWGRYSVMTTTVAEGIKWAIQRRLRFVNLSAGTDVSKTRWGPQAFSTWNGVLVSPSRRGRALWSSMKQAASAGRVSPLLAPLISLVRRRG